MCLFVVQLGSVIRDYPLPYILKGNYARHIGGGLFPIRDIYLLLANHDVRKCQVAIFTLQNTNAHFSYKNHEPCHQWQCSMLCCTVSATQYCAVHLLSRRVPVPAPPWCWCLPSQLARARRQLP